MTPTVAQCTQTEAQPFVGASLESACDESYDAVEDARLAMQRALIRWDLFGTFDCAAEYTLAHAKWRRLKAEGREC